MADATEAQTSYRKGLCGRTCEMAASLSLSTERLVTMRCERPVDQTLSVWRGAAFATRALDVSAAQSGRGPRIGAPVSCAFSEDGRQKAPSGGALARPSNARIKGRARNSISKPEKEAVIGHMQPRPDDLEQMVRAGQKLSREIGTAARSDKAALFERRGASQAKSVANHPASKENGAPRQRPHGFGAASIANAFSSHLPS